MIRVIPVLLLLPMLTPTLIVTTLTQMQLCGKRQQGLWVGSKQIYPTDRQWANWKLAPVAARVANRRATSISRCKEWGRAVLLITS